MSNCVDHGKSAILILDNQRTKTLLSVSILLSNHLFLLFIADISQCVDSFTECRFVQNQCNIAYIRHVCPRTCSFCHHPGEYQDTYSDLCINSRKCIIKFLIICFDICVQVHIVSKHYKAHLHYFLVHSECEDNPTYGCSRWTAFCSYTSIQMQCPETCSAPCAAGLVSRNI